MQLSGLCTGRAHYAEKLRGRLGGWAANAVHALEDAWPDMPPGITDRPADVWEPLLACADHFGGH